MNEGLDESKPVLKFSVAALATGVLAGAILPGANGPGLGIPLVAVAVAGSVALLAAPQLKAHGVVFGSLSLFLTIFAMFRAASWVVALDLLFAVALSSYALGGGSTWLATVRGLFAAGGRLHRAPSFLMRPLMRGAKEGRASVGPALRGAAAGAVLLVIFGGLFVTADTAFAQITSNVVSGALPQVESLPIRLVVGIGIALFATSLVLVTPRFAPKESDGSGFFAKAGWAAPGDRSGAAPNRERMEWLIPLVSLNLLFAAFVLVQLTVLFGGRKHVLDTAGLTYAEYARSGFFQLVAVAALTLMVLAGASWWTAKAEQRDRRIVRVLLGALCVLTLVVLASALRRIELYEDAYGLTRLRLFVHATILWLGAFFVLVIGAGMVGSRWLPRALVTTTALALILFTWMNPDATIARENVARFNETGRIDTFFLKSLSADAVPALLELPEPFRACSLQRLAIQLQTPDAWFGWNQSRSDARNLLGEVRVPDGESCLINRYGSVVDPSG